MILSNISVPLLGLVDTAVIGHLGSAHYLAGIALASTVITMLFWLVGFLRMSTTGLIATAYGEQNRERMVGLLFQGGVLALLIAGLLIALHPLIGRLMEWLASAPPETLEQAWRYFSIRIWSAPAALLNLVMLGWMLGMHFGRGPFYLVLVTNLCNIVLDIVLVVGLDMGVAGAAWASLLSDYLALGFALWLVARVARARELIIKRPAGILQGMGRLCSLNRDIFLRSLLLQLCFSFLTFYGARLGTSVLAANAVLLNFLLLVSFALDGIAYAAEAKVGYAKGQKDLAALKCWVRYAGFWGGIFAALYALWFAVFGRELIGWLTDLPEVITTASAYLGWLTWLPLIAMPCFILDGVFVGLMRAKAMRNSMLFAAVFGFFVPFALLSEWQNNALWAAMTGFMLLRGVSLFYLYRRAERSGRLLL